jgi:hypothetical protein
MKRRGAKSGIAYRAGVSEGAKARAAAVGLWAMVVLGAIGGVTALAGRSTGPSEYARPTPSGAITADVLAVAGFAERFVAAYLAAEPGTEDDLAGFLGYTPELPSNTEPVRPAATVRVVGAEAMNGRYWAVTVAAAETGREVFWRVGVLHGEGRLVAIGPPTPVAAPSDGDRPELVVGVSEVPPVDDPVVATVAGWVAAYACGQGDASRYLAPGVDVDPVTPPVCSQARLDRWGSDADGPGRVTVVTEAVLTEGGAERRVSFALVLARRGGRWEIAELLGAPPLAGSGEGGEEVVAG